MAGVGEHYYVLHAGRRGNAAADEAMLRAVPFLRKLGERAHFSQDEHGTQILLERVAQHLLLMRPPISRLNSSGWSARIEELTIDEFQQRLAGCEMQNCQLRNFAIMYFVISLTRNSEKDQLGNR